MELLSVEAGTGMIASFPEPVSVVKVSGLRPGTWKSRVATGGRKNSFDLQNGSKLLFKSHFGWRTWECCLGKSLWSELLLTNPDWGQGSSALWLPAGPGQAREHLPEAQATGTARTARLGMTMRGLGCQQRHPQDPRGPTSR